MFNLRTLLGWRRGREIVLDTETTGLNVKWKHRIVEIGCIELMDGVPTGQSFQRYLNPERKMPKAAFEKHGLSCAFLKDKPLFADIVDDFLAFIGDAPLVVHNAPYDRSFLNAELARAGRLELERERFVDTLPMARRKHPWPQRNRLDDLCLRYGINNGHRDKHAALLDAELLVQVYAELTSHITWLGIWRRLQDRALTVSFGMSVASVIGVMALSLIR